MFEDTVELPKLILLPIVEGMIVALRALHLNAQKQSRDNGGRWHCLVIEMRQQEIRGSVFIGRPFRGDEVGHYFVPRTVLNETVSQKLLQLRAIDVP